MTQRALLLQALSGSRRWNQADVQVTFPGMIFIGARPTERGDERPAGPTEFLVVFENDVLYLAEPGIVEVLTVVEARARHVPASGGR